MSELVLVERDDRGVVRVTLNRPEARNALSLAVNRRLIEIAEELSGDRSARVVVLTGAGDKAFCAGADLKERKGISAADSGPYIDAISGAINAWANLEQPTVAAVNGFAFGGGMELALACDFRIATSNAQFGLTEVRLGIMPGAGGTQRLPRLIGVARAKDLILRGRRLPATEARELGLVSHVMPADDLDTEIENIVSDLLASAPLSVLQAKRAIDRGVEVGIDEGLRIERDCYDVTLFSDDRNEGLLAFAEKRPPEFKGR